MAMAKGHVILVGSSSWYALACVCCGQTVDFIAVSELPYYLDYVGRTGDVAFCGDCDRSQDDIIHPLVEDVSCMVLEGKRAECSCSICLSIEPLLNSNNG